MDLIQSLVTLFLIHSLTRVIHLRWIVFDSLKRTNSEFAMFRAIDSVAVLMYNCAGTQTSGHIQIHCLVLFLWRQHRCIAYCLWFPTILCVSLAVDGTNENGIWWKSWNNSWMSFFNMWFHFQWEIIFVVLRTKTYKNQSRLTDQLGICFQFQQPWTLCFCWKIDAKLRVC